ncbi:hypothetical protein L7F22_016745 [Adiantum nelumboides]|nr:hypothetical protein [Adiantum nelumboides]
MKGVVSGASQILPNEAQAPEQARWALGIADVGLQGTRPGRGIESKPNDYRLAPDEYEVCDVGSPNLCLHAHVSPLQILASAAAIATVALTTAKSGTEREEASSSTSGLPLDNTFAGSQGRSSRALCLEEQDEITSTLRAWLRGIAGHAERVLTLLLATQAGLEGAERQAEARKKLQQRQAQLTAKNSRSETQFFPPTLHATTRWVVSVLRILAQSAHVSSLRALTVSIDGSGSGVLSKSALGWSHGATMGAVDPAWPGFSPTVAAPPSAPPRQRPLTSSSLTSASLLANTGTSSDDFQRLQRDAMEAKNQSRPAKAHQQPPQQTDDDPVATTRPRLEQQQPHTKGEGGPATVDPMQLISNASNAAGLDVSSPQLRDQLLHYAHNLYSNGSPTTTLEQSEEDKKLGRPAKTATKMHPTLLPLLHTLHNLHSQHLPTLLLLSCAYYSCGDLAASLWYNKLILRIDHNYVESMSNIGTTLRALGRWKEAESWWWRAIKLRPGYWDAYENLLGVLCSPQQLPPGKDADPVMAQGEQEQAGQMTGPRFVEALKLCDFVESHVLSASRGGGEGEERARKVPGGGDRPICMPSHLPVAQMPRLQNLLYAKGNLKYVMPTMGTVPAAKEYQKAVEVMLSPSEQSAYSLRDLVVATYVVGVLTMGVLIPGAAASNATAEIAQTLGLDPGNTQHEHLAASAQFTSLSSGGILRLVRDAGDAIVNLLLRTGRRPLAHSYAAPRVDGQTGICTLCRKWRQSSRHCLQCALTATRCGRGHHSAGKRAGVFHDSTILLTLSKLFQDCTGTVVVGPHGPLTLGGIPASTSLLLPLYYLSISLNPSASTANNLGILLSSIPAVASVQNSMGQRQQMNGQALALQYYTYGLQLDPKHPHLYTNFGSLLKDLNHLNEAIQMYEKAIECNPDFDVALANLGNAIKDQGKTQESVQYYRRAVKVNPNFPEALCGLVNALLAICDWSEVYEDDDDGRRGFMNSVRELLEKQLEDGALYGARALSVEGRIEDWVELVVKSTGDTRAEYRAYLRAKFGFFYNDQLDRKALKINEGSFVIRLVERLLRRSQRRWYVDEYVLGNRTGRIEPMRTDVQRYPRIPLPSCLVAPTVPTILPFHTFTLKIPPRHIRLISHRNALRISQTTLTQLWLPAHVYPPPPPPRPKIKVGYISSDFNNHPLAHLMQSVFGFHNLDEFDVYLYATTVSDQSPYRTKIESEAQHFYDVSQWSNQDVIKKVLEDGIHILMNLNGYTKGARNEIFAARPCPVQMEFMGFAGGLASGWTDWIVVDPIVCPPEMTDEWVYTEKFIYMPDSYFVNDHRQGFREPTEREAVDGIGTVRPHEMTTKRRGRRRKSGGGRLARRCGRRCLTTTSSSATLTSSTSSSQRSSSCGSASCSVSPTASSGYCDSLPQASRTCSSTPARLVDPSCLARHLHRGCSKGVHIHRGRIADLFLDTLECGAHTTSADILWSATPVLTWPRHKHKMASRVAASIVQATGLGEDMIVDSEKDYEDRAVELAKGLRYTYVDAHGKELTPALHSGTIRADALEVNPDSAPAMPHARPPPSSSPAGEAGSQPQGTMADPAPANVRQAASVSEGASSSATTLPDRRNITLVVRPGEQAPPATATRRAHGPWPTFERRCS